MTIHVFTLDEAVMRVVERNFTPPLPDGAPPRTAPEHARLNLLSPAQQAVLAPELEDLALSALVDGVTEMVYDDELEMVKIRLTPKGRVEAQRSQHPKRSTKPKRKKRK